VIPPILPISNYDSTNSTKFRVRFHESKNGTPAVASRPVGKKPLSHCGNWVFASPCSSQKDVRHSQSLETTLAEFLGRGN